MFIASTEMQTPGEAAQQCSCEWLTEEHCVGMTFVSNLRKQKAELLRFQVISRR